MHWLRSTAARLVMALCMAGLMGLALVVSFRLTLTDPHKVEAWLNQSGFYDSVVQDTIDDAAKNSNDADSVTFTDPATQAAAKAALPKATIARNANAVIEGNYDWLNGRTKQPSFTLDFTSTKQQFATNLAESARQRLATLPVCTTAQLAELQATTINPLTLTCRPAGIDTDAAIAQLQQQASQSSAFMPNQTITADTLGSITNNASTQTSTPYYQRLSWLPIVYQASAWLPYLLAVLVIASGAAAVALATSIRQGIRRLAVGLISSGVTLLAFKFGLDILFKRLQDTFLPLNTGGGQRAQAMTTFLQIIEHHAVRVDAWFGAAYIAIGVSGLLYLLVTRSKPPTAALPVESTLT